MRSLRSIMIALVCVALAAPTHVFSACCCGDGLTLMCACSGSASQCPCCHTSTGDSNCCGDASDCNSNCKCGHKQTTDAVILVDLPVRDKIAFSQHPPTDLVPPASTLESRFAHFTPPPVTHNRRQAILCVWVK